MNALTLPPLSFAAVETRRLAHPGVVWTGPLAAAAGFDPEQLYCCPKPYEADDLYTSDTRVELADRYGGIGTGGAGGSGRCATWGGLQTKGVGVTSLVAPDADWLHSTGTLSLEEAAVEAAFGEAFRIALPHGAVPIHAVVTTGGQFVRTLEPGKDVQSPRALAIRPFVVRPAHFMRNLSHPAGRLPAGPSAVGWTSDGWRTRLSLSTLAFNLKKALVLEGADDEVSALDQGLRELARRYAQQVAASFAKRLPHGTLTCSNIALDGSFLDFGLSSFVASYRRCAWTHLGGDSWSESQPILRTLLLLRQQLEKYHLGSRNPDVVSAEALMAEFNKELDVRLGIEMAKMAGLTEDMAALCPAELLAALLGAMRAIWTRGADERCFTFAGKMADGTPPPAPRSLGRYDLTAILAAAGPTGDPDALDAKLAPLLDDHALRHRFVNAAMAVRSALRQAVGERVSAGLDQYLGLQADRKNSSLSTLKRYGQTWDALKALELTGNSLGVASVIDQCVAQARHVLPDLCPSLAGESGMEQLRELVAASPAVANQSPQIHAMSV